MTTNSLTNRFTLVSLSFSSPQMTKKDKTASDEVAADKGASSQAVAVVKNLYPKHLLEPITTNRTAATKFLNSLTGEAAIRGLAMLPNEKIVTFRDGIETFRLQEKQAVTVFAQNYANNLLEAERQQGALFDAKEYPDVSEVAAQFTMNVQYLFLSEVPNVISGVEAGMMADFKAEVEEQQRERIARSQKDLYTRLGAAVKRIATQCGNEKGRIYDTLTGNLEELLKVLPLLNIADDPVFTDLCAQAQRLVVAPEALKTVPAVREAVAARADAILDAMKDFL